MEVTEFERTKTNVPVNIRNCFQVHKLTFTSRAISKHWKEHGFRHPTRPAIVVMATRSSPAGPCKNSSFTTKAE